MLIDSNFFLSNFFQNTTVFSKCSSIASKVLSKGFVGVVWSISNYITLGRFNVKLDWLDIKSLPKKHIDLLSKIKAKKDDLPELGYICAFELFLFSNFRGFLKSDKGIGQASVKLTGFANKCEIHECVDVSLLSLSTIVQGFFLKKFPIISDSTTFNESGRNV